MQYDFHYHHLMDNTNTEYYIFNLKINKYHCHSPINDVLCFNLSVFFLFSPSRCAVCLPVQSIPAVESMSSSTRPATPAKPAPSASQDKSHIW